MILVIINNNENCQASTAWQFYFNNCKVIVSVKPSASDEQSLL